MEKIKLHLDARNEIQALANARATSEAQLQTLINATLWANGKTRTDYASVQFADGCLELHPLAPPPTPPAEEQSPPLIKEGESTHATPSPVAKAVKSATNSGAHTRRAGAS